MVTMRLSAAHVCPCLTPSSASAAPVVQPAALWLPLSPAAILAGVLVSAPFPPSAGFPGWSYGAYTNQRGCSTQEEVQGLLAEHKYPLLPSSPPHWRGVVKISHSARKLGTETGPLGQAGSQDKEGSKTAWEDAQGQGSLFPIILISYHCSCSWVSCCSRALLRLSRSCCNCWLRSSAPRRACSASCNLMT